MLPNEKDIRDCFKILELKSEVCAIYASNNFLYVANVEYRNHQHQDCYLNFEVEGPLREFTFQYKPDYEADDADCLNKVANCVCVQVDIAGFFA